jgi:hypothetical protein
MLAIIFAATACLNFAQSPAPVRLLSQNLDARGWQVLDEPEKVQISAVVEYRYVPGSTLLSGLPVQRFGSPRPVSKHERSELLKEFIRPVAPKNLRCGFRIDHIVEYQRGGDVLVVATCHGCREVAAFFNGRQVGPKLPLESFPSLEQLVRSKFSEDEETARKEKYLRLWKVKRPAKS